MVPIPGSPNPKIFQDFLTLAHSCVILHSLLTVLQRSFCLCFNFATVLMRINSRALTVCSILALSMLLWSCKHGNDITRISKSGYILTVTTNDPQSLLKGDQITIAGVDDPTFNGTYVVIATGSPDAYSFTCWDPTKPRSGPAIGLPSLPGRAGAVRPGAKSSPGASQNGNVTFLRHLKPNKKFVVPDSGHGHHAYTIHSTDTSFALLTWWSSKDSVGWVECDLPVGCVNTASAQYFAAEGAVNGPTIYLKAGCQGAPSQVTDATFVTPATGVNGSYGYANGDTPAVPLSDGRSLRHYGEAPDDSPIQSNPNSTALVPYFLNGTPPQAKSFDAITLIQWPQFYGDTTSFIWQCSGATSGKGQQSQTVVVTVSAQ